jgi:ElaB/YqjD/DUF883 family membrane-anchored ribosome-binding protein
MATGTLNDEIAALREDYTRLQADLTGLMRTVRELAGQKADTLREAAAEEIGKLCDETGPGIEGEKIEGAAEAGEVALNLVAGQIERHPLASVLIAFLGGMLVGRVLAR